MRVEGTHGNSRTGKYVTWGGAALFIAAVLLLVWLRFIYDDMAREHSGPNALAVNGAAVFLNLNSSLLRSTPGSIDELDLRRLGIDGPVVDLQALSGDTLLVGMGWPGRLFECSFREPRCRNLGIEAHLPQGGFKFFREADGKLWISDGGNDRLHLLEGNERSTLSTPGQLQQQNRVRRHGDDIVVADTNHHRIAAFTVDNARLTEAWAFQTHNHPGKRASRIWPIDFAIDAEGNRWVINGNNLLEDGDLVRFDRQGVPLDRVSMPEGADPISIQYTGGQMLVTDYNNYRLHAIDSVGLHVRELERPALQARLLEEKALGEHFDRRSMLALAGLAGLFLMAFPLAIWLQRRKPGLSRIEWPESQMSSGERQEYIAAVPKDGILWLPFSKPMERVLIAWKWLNLLVVAPFLLLGAFLVYLQFASGEISTELAIRIMAGSAMVVAVILFGGNPVKNLGRYRLGVRGEEVYFREEGAVPVKVDLSSSLYDEHVLLVPGKSFPLLLGQSRKPIYDKSFMDASLLPLLERHSARAKRVDILRMQWIHRDPVFMNSLYLILIMTVVLLIILFTGNW